MFINSNQKNTFRKEAFFASFFVVIRLKVLRNCYCTAAFLTSSKTKSVFKRKKGKCFTEGLKRQIDKVKFYKFNF